MQYRYTLLALAAATGVMAAPLNINMGAYSPALVVGDGAIGFKGTESVTNLMNTLQGAAANSAAKANGAAAPGTAAAPATAAAIAPAGELPQGMGKNISPLPVVTRSDATTATDGAVLTAEELEILEDAADEDDLTKRTVEVGDAAELTAEELEILEDAADEAAAGSASRLKRDIAGFNAALAYASSALKTSPEVQLGTGEGGSGVGITQKAGGVTTGKKAAGIIAGREA